MINSTKSSKQDFDKDNKKFSFEMSYKKRNFNFAKM